MIEQTVLPLILASQSATRKRLLTKAGVPYEAADHEVDEVVLRARLKGDACSSEDAAHRLAEQKAKSVSTKFPDRLTLGADQLFVCEDHWLGKVSSVQEANDMLRRLSGKEHALITAISCVENGREVWSCIDTVRMTMRPLSEAFIAYYVEKVSRSIEGGSHLYQLENLGIQLFSQIRGDYFSVLGLPLLPLLPFLRERGLLPA